MNLVGVGRADAPPSGADGAGARASRKKLLQRAVECLVIRHDHVGAAGDLEIVTDLDVPGSEAVDLIKQLGRIDHHAVGDDAGAAGKEDARRNEVQRVSLIAHHDGVAGIGATVVSDDEVMIVCEEIDELALAFERELVVGESQLGGAVTMVLLDGSGGLLDLRENLFTINFSDLALDLLFSGDILSYT